MSGPELGALKWSRTFNIQIGEAAITGKLLLHHSSVGCLAAAERSNRADQAVGLGDGDGDARAGRVLDLRERKEAGTRCSECV